MNEDNLVEALRLIAKALHTGREPYEVTSWMEIDEKVRIKALGLVDQVREARREHIDIADYREMVASCYDPEAYL